MLISFSIFSLRNNAWGFKKLNTSFHIQILLNRFSASLRKRSIASSMHLLISSTTERPIRSSACSPGIFFFLQTRRSSIGISCFSPILIAVLILCLTSATRSLTKNAKHSSCGNSFSVTNLFAVNILGYHKILIKRPSKIVKKKQRKMAELHPIYHELILVYQYFCPSIAPS